MYTYTCDMCTYLRAHIQTCVWIYEIQCAWTYAYIDICIHVCMYVRTYVPMYVECLYVYIMCTLYIYMHAYVHIHIYIYLYIHICVCIRRYGDAVLYDLVWYGMIFFMHAGMHACVPTHVCMREWTYA